MTQTPRWSDGWIEKVLPSGTYYWIPASTYLGSVRLKAVLEKLRNQHLLQPIPY